jgi:hypothetical protein
MRPQYTLTTQAPRSAYVLGVDVGGGPRPYSPLTMICGICPRTRFDNASGVLPKVAI